MKRVTLQDAQTYLHRFVKDVVSGREAEVLITEGGRPIARLVPYVISKRRLGIDAGLLRIPEDFDEPDPEIERLFCGEPDDR